MVTANLMNPDTDYELGPFRPLEITNIGHHSRGGLGAFDMESIGDINKTRVWSAEETRT